MSLLERADRMRHPAAIDREIPSRDVRSSSSM